MFTRIPRAVGAALLSGVLFYGGLAFADSPCGKKENCAQAPAKKCGICDVLFGKHPCGICAKKPKPAPVAACPEPASPCAKDGKMTADLPPDAQPGDCYAKVIVPAEFKTVTERHLTQEASERLEVIPAQLKWVEEQILVKEAVNQLEVVPAEYKWTEKTIMVQPSHTGWMIEKTANCANPEKSGARGGVFCLRTTPPAYKTVRTKCLVKPATVRTVTIPAEYQTVRKQVVAVPATTRSIPIPEEYAEVTKTVLVCPERVRWEHIVCEEKLSSDTVNKVKTALIASGFTPGPLNGKLAAEDWAALNAYQSKNRLGVGQLTYETLKQLRVSIQ